MAMRNPPHPGVNIREGWMVDGMSVLDAATRIGVSPDTLGQVLGGHQGISPELASKLEAAGWSRGDLWLRLQAAYDKAQSGDRNEARKLPEPMTRWLYLLQRKRPPSASPAHCRPVRVRRIPNSPALRRYRYRR